MDANRRVNNQTGARVAVRTAAAFTLLEMMLVVAIIGILGAVTVVSLIGQSTEARKKATAASMRTIATGIKSYKADKGVFPSTLNALVDTKFLDKVPKDAWKRDFIYSSPGAGGKEFSLISLGDDQQQGTEDDIDWWKIDADE